MNDSLFDSIPDLKLKVFNAVAPLMIKRDFYIKGISEHGDGKSGHLEDIIISEYRDHVYVKTVGIHGDTEVSIYTISHDAEDDSLDGIVLHPIILFADADCPVYSPNNIVKLKQTDLFKEE